MICVPQVSFKYIELIYEIYKVLDVCLTGCSQGFQGHTCTTGES